jgi:hypothetical protein
MLFANLVETGDCKEVVCCSLAWGRPVIQKGSMLFANLGETGDCKEVVGYSQTWGRPVIAKR